MNITALIPNDLFSSMEKTAFPLRKGGTLKKHTIVLCDKFEKRKIWAKCASFLKAK